MFCCFERGEKLEIGKGVNTFWSRKERRMHVMQKRRLARIFVLWSFSTFCHIISADFNGFYVKY